MEHILLSFKLYEGFKKPNLSKNLKIVFVSGGIGIFILIIAIFNIFPIFFGIFGLLSLLIMVIINFSSFFNDEEHSKTYIGNIQFKENSIIFIDRQIFWEEMKCVIVTYFDIKGALTTTSKFENKLSSGVKNYVFIEDKSGIQYSGNFLLDDKIKSLVMKELFWEVVKSRKLSFENSKGILHPEFYKDIQELKKYSKN